MNHRTGLPSRRLFTPVAIAALLCGCAMPGSRYQGRAAFASTVDRTHAVEVAVGVMQEYGYTPGMVNERVGTITSDWRSDDNWVALLFGRRSRDRITVTLSDSMLTLTGEYQARRGRSFGMFGMSDHGEGGRDTGWFGVSPPDGRRAEWDDIRDEVIRRAQALPRAAVDEAASAAAYNPEGRKAAAVALPTVEPLAREDRTRVAVVEFKGIGLSPDEVLILTDRLRAELVGTGRFTVVERERMNEILAEQGFQQSELCSTDDCVVEMGRLVGVDSIIAGTFGKLGDTYTVTARLIDVESGEITARASEDCACAIDELLRSMRRLSVLLASRAE